MDFAATPLIWLCSWSELWYLCWVDLFILMSLVASSKYL